MSDFWHSRTLLITGASGSFGHAFIRLALAHLQPRKIIVFSRDELKQHEMRQRFEAASPHYDGPLRFFIGDVRDRERLRRAFRGVDIVIHAAALKHVRTGEYDPSEVVATNIQGSMNAADAAIEEGVRHFLFLSSDKAVEAVNLYGQTKAVAERYTVSANVYADRTALSAVRYGNVVGSRGSVVEKWRGQAARQEALTITDPGATRFWLRIENAVRFVAACAERARGGEVFVPLAVSSSVALAADLVAPSARLDVIGLQRGEKKHECLLTRHEAACATYTGLGYTVYPAGLPEGLAPLSQTHGEEFAYASDTNPARAHDTTSAALREALGA